MTPLDELLKKSLGEPETSKETLLAEIEERQQAINKSSFGRGILLPYTEEELSLRSEIDSINQEKGGGHLAPPGTRYRGEGFTRSNEIMANFGSWA